MGYTFITLNALNHGHFQSFDCIAFDIRQHMSIDIKRIFGLETLSRMHMLNCYPNVINAVLTQSKENYCKCYFCNKKYSHRSYAPDQRGELNSQYKGGHRLKDGYILTLKHDHPNCDSRGYIPEHRLIMEASIGWYIKPDEIVHHINGDKTDNRIENLMLMKWHIHSKFHSLLRKSGINMSTLSFQEQIVVTNYYYQQAVQAYGG